LLVNYYDNDATNLSKGYIVELIHDQNRKIAASFKNTILINN